MHALGRYLKRLKKVIEEDAEKEGASANRHGQSLAVVRECMLNFECNHGLFGREARTEGKGRETTEGSRRERTGHCRSSATAGTLPHKAGECNFRERIPGGESTGHSHLEGLVQSHGRDREISERITK